MGYIFEIAALLFVSLVVVGYLLIQSKAVNIQVERQEINVSKNLLFTILICLVCWILTIHDPKSIVTWASLIGMVVVELVLFRKLENKKFLYSAIAVCIYAASLFINFALLRLITTYCVLVFCIQGFEELSFAAEVVQRIKKAKATALIFVLFSGVQLRTIIQWFLIWQIFHMIIEFCEQFYTRQHISNKQINPIVLCVCLLVSGTIFYHGYTAMNVQRYYDKAPVSYAIPVDDDFLSVLYYREKEFHFNFAYPSDEILSGESLVIELYQNDICIYNLQKELMQSADYWTVYESSQNKVDLDVNQPVKIEYKIVREEEIILSKEINSEIKKVPVFVGEGTNYKIIYAQAGYGFESSPVILAKNTYLINIVRYRNVLTSVVYYDEDDNAILGSAGAGTMGFGIQIANGHSYSMTFEEGIPAYGILIVYVYNQDSNEYAYKETIRLVPEP